MHPRTLATFALAAAFMVAACTSAGPSPSPTAATSPSEAPTPTGAPAEPVVATAETALGIILVGADGRTLYGFTRDEAGEPTCYEACAEAWPPVIVEGEIPVAAGLEESLFSIVARTDGTNQLKVGDWPLYRFAADAAAGDTNGQGVNDVWFAVDASGQLVRPTATATVASAQSSLGTILVDADGRTLYGFTPDEAGQPTCYDSCAQAWPPLVVDGEVSVASGLDASLFTTVARTDGSLQVKAGDWPLYRFANDQAAGDTNGQGINDVWFVVGTDGQLIR